MYHKGDQTLEQIAPRTVEFPSLEILKTRPDGPKKLAVADPALSMGLELYVHTTNFIRLQYGFSSQYS